MKTTLYFAYGSNLNIVQMRRRCPDARPICRMTLRGYKLVFRGVADVVFERGAKVAGALWRITAADEAKLDTYEGVRGGLYRKVYVPVTTFKGETCMLMYVMNSDGIYPPSQGYLEGIIDGYKHFQMDDEARHMLDMAVTEAWDDKRPSYKERERSARYGWPKLARPKHCNNCGFCPRPARPKREREDWKISLKTINKLMTEQCAFEWKGGRCARSKGHPNGHRIQ